MRSSPKNGLREPATPPRAETSPGELALPARHQRRLGAGAALAEPPPAETLATAYRGYGNRRSHLARVEVRLRAPPAIAAQRAARRLSRHRHTGRSAHPSL